MKYKLIASDLDGTLLDSRAELSSVNKAAIDETVKSGVLFVPVTGRAMYEMPRDIVDNDNIRYIISSNGAVVYDKLTGEKQTYCFSSKRFSQIYELLKTLQCTMTIHYDLKSYFNKEIDNDERFDYYEVNGYYRNHIRTTNEIIDNFDEFFSEPREVEMLSIFFKYESELEECRKALLAMGDVEITGSTKGNLEIVRKGALKGVALGRLSEITGIPMADIITAGDSKNDLSMLSLSGLSLATSNAIDEVKETADKVICSNDEHIAKYILDNIL